MSENYSKTTQTLNEKPRIRVSRRILTALGWSVWLVASFVLAQLLIVGLFYVLDRWGVEVKTESVLMLFGLEVVIYALMGALLVGGPWVVRKVKATWRDFGFRRKINWQDFIVYPGALVLYFILTAVLAYAADSYLPGYDIEQEQQIGFSGLSNAFEYILVFASLVIVAPIVEELLFRGFLHTKIRRVLGRTGAVFLVAALFGLVHMQLNVMIDTFALGLVMGLMREYTGSIYTSILMHMTKNGIAFYFLFVNPLALSSLT